MLFADRCTDGKVCCLKKKIFIIVLLVFLIFVCIWYAFFFKRENDIPKNSENAETIENNENNEGVFTGQNLSYSEGNADTEGTYETGTDIWGNVTVTPTPIPKIYVFLCGSVKNPGVYGIAKGSRINDLLSVAGGFTEYADKNYLNLARGLTDGERVYVPSVFETDELNIKENILGAGASEPVTEENVSMDTEAEDSLININTADKEALVALPGIGESRAADILEYREKIGSFKSVEEIKNISGIGESVYARIKNYICVK